MVAMEAFSLILMAFLNNSMFAKWPVLGQTAILTIRKTQHLILKFQFVKFVLCLSINLTVLSEQVIINRLFPEVLGVFHIWYQYLKLFSSIYIIGHKGVIWKVQLEVPAQVKC